MEYAECLPAVRQSHPQLANTIEHFVTLEHVLKWLTLEDYPLGSLEMTTQDEYCHDLFLPLPDGQNWLVFGIT